MKNILRLGVLIIFVVTGCENDNDRQTSTLILSDTIKVNYKEIRYNYENHLSICWDSVLNDSRCPKDVVCKWAGNAEVRMLFSCYNNLKTIILNTHGGESFRTDTLIGGFKIKLLKLTPYPETSSKIPQENYTAEIIITDN
jgi:hypothetical protein